MSMQPSKRAFRTISGIKIPYADHHKLRQLKREFTPSNHGHKVWPSSWLLIDYLKKTKAVSGRRVMDLGCGWGLGSVYCAKKQNAAVISVDMDQEVYPFLDLVAAMNGVTVDFLNLEIDQIRKNLLAQIDVIIGADICFCDSLTDSLRKLILRAKAASVQRILISDPGRWPFDDLAEQLVRRIGATVVDWETGKPQRIAGKILDIRF